LQIPFSSTKNSQQSIRDNWSLRKSSAQHLIKFAETSSKKEEEVSCHFVIIEMNSSRAHSSARPKFQRHTSNCLVVRSLHDVNEVVGSQNSVLRNNLGAKSFDFLVDLFDPFSLLLNRLPTLRRKG
jgi:hypothetical protein